MAEELTFESMRKERQVSSFEQMRLQQEAWRPPTLEEEAVHDDWSVFAATAAAVATAPILGTAAAITAGITTLAGDKGSEILGELAGEVHPALKIPTYIGAGVLSAFTLENWLIKNTAKAASLNIPKFWSKEFAVAKQKGLLSEQFVDSSANIIRGMDMGDKKAMSKMLNIFKQEVYQAKMIKTGKQLERLQKLRQPAVPASKIVKQLKKKKFLSNADYYRLSEVAKEEAISSYTKEFNTIRTKTIKENADAIWQNHKMKDVFEAIIDGGGVSPNYKFATPELKDAIMTRHPTMKATKAVTANLKKIASDFEYSSIDNMVDDVLKTPNRTQIRRTAGAELQHEFNRIYRDEVLVRISEREADYLFKLQDVEGKGLEKALRLEAKTALSRASNTLPAHMVIREVTALKGSMQRLLRIMQHPNISKVKLLTLQKKHIEQLARYRAAVKIKKELGLINNRLKNTTKLSGEWGEQLHNLLSPLFNGTTKKLDTHMFQFLASKFHDEVSIGADVLIKKYDGLLKNFPFSKRNFMSLTYDQAKDLDEFVKVYKYVANNEKYITIGAQRKLIANIANNIEQTAVTTISKVKALRPPVLASQLEELSKKTQGKWLNSQRTSSGEIHWALAGLKRIEPICFQLDGFKPFGRAWSAIFNKTIMAQVAEEKLGRTVFDNYDSIWKAHAKITKIKPQKYWSATGGSLVGLDLNKEIALMIYMNSKNADNLKAMLEGLQIPKIELNKFLKASLNNADLKLADDIFDSLDELFPIIAKVYKEKTGLTLQRAKGGRYFPILADRRYAILERNIDDLFLDTTDELFKAEVKKTFTELRVGGVKAVRLEFDGLTQHLRDVVHLTTHWTPINEIQRLTKNLRFKNAVVSTMGQDIYNQFQPWLQHLARPTVTKIDTIASKVRRNVTAASLMLVPSTAVKQTLSFITAMPVVGYSNAVSSLTKFIHNPLAISKMIKNASPEMATRSMNWNRDMMEVMASVSHKGQTYRMLKFGYKFIHWMDDITSSTIWLAGYKKGLQIFDGNANLALNNASLAVRSTQPASAAKDVPRIMRSGEAGRGVSMFYSYWSVFHNQVGTEISKALAGFITPAQVARTLAWLFIAPAVVQHLTRSAWNALAKREQEEERLKDIAKGSITNAVSGLPVVRDIVTSAIRGFDYKVSPIIQFPKDITTGLKTTAKIFDEEEDITQRDIESAVMLGSYILPYPSRQMITAVRAAIRRYEGEIDNLDLFFETIDRPPYEKK